ncbi:hypothetical protein [Clostridium botulinum]|uniref:hypothetical protein n=1 Tax=Clostridium botulinum TaxID=1491 RepID=UPI001966F184|nr:hypothetical protein [Clostridium botulinum]MBN1078072.1 hypothetical protein [Clostridium botulinum]
METCFVGLNGNCGDKEIENYFYEECIKNNIPIIDNRHPYEIRAITACGSFLQLVLSNLSISDLISLAGVLYGAVRVFKNKDSRFFILGKSIIINKDDTLEEIEAKLKCAKKLENIEKKRRKVN